MDPNISRLVKKMKSQETKTKEAYVLQLMEDCSLALGIDTRGMGFEALKIRRLRSAITERATMDTLSEIDSGGVTLVESKHSFGGGIKHNIHSLRNLKGFDRGSLLVDSFFSLFADREFQRKSCLFIGPRNISEIIAAISHGVNPENVTAIDLIPAPPLIEQCDAHELSRFFKNNFYDVFFVGWVFPYTSDPFRLISEICKCAKNEFYLTVGYDSDPGICFSGDRAFNIDNIIDFMSGFACVDVIFRRNATSPLDHESKRVIACVRVLKIYSPRAQYFEAEYRAVERAYSMLPSEYRESETVRYVYAAHLHFLEVGDYNDVVETGYRIMRQHQTDLRLVLNEHASDCLSMFLDSSVSGWPLKSRLEFSESIDTVLTSLDSDGYYIFSKPLPSGLLDDLEKIGESISLCPGRTVILSNKIEEEWLLDFCLDSYFLQIASSFLGSIPIFESIEVWKSLPIDLLSEGRLSQDALLFHSDLDRLKWLKIFVYLSDVDIDSGPHEYIPGTHSAVTSHLRLADHDALSFGSSKKILGKRGTVFIGDTRCLHKGNPVKSGLRHVLQLQYSNSLFGAAVSRVESSCIENSVYKSLARSFPKVFANFGNFS